MAIVWGSYVNNFRLGIDIVGSTWIVYGESNAYGHDWNYTLQFGGSWGSGTKSGHFYSGWGQTVRRELHRTTRPNSTQSNNVRLTSALVNGAYVSRSITVTPKPSAPRIDRVVRNSDTSHRVEWTRYATATSVRLERRTNGGSWQHVSSVSSNAASITDTTTRANNRYQYRVRVANAGGTSGWSNLSSNVYTTPAVPSAVTATRVGDNIRVNGSVPAVASHVDIQDNGTGVSGAIAVGSLPWTHTNPDQAVTHRYRMRARVNSGTSNSTLLTSAYSAYSATVQLTAPPAAPTQLAPNGAAVPADIPVTLKWTHNPVDSSELTRWEVRYRKSGSSSAWEEMFVEAPIWTGSYTVTQSRWAQMLAVGPEIEWQARTRGAHPSMGAWSAVARFTALDAPGVAITGPVAGEWLSSTLPVTWSFFQAQGRPQSSWRARLMRAGEVVESKQGTGSATSTTFSSRLEDGESYTVEVEAATGNIWSTVESVTVDATFILPAPGVLSASWNESTGAVDLEVSIIEQAAHADVINYAPRIQGSGTSVEVRRNFVLNPRAATGVGLWREARATVRRTESLINPSKFRFVLTVTERGSAPSVIYMAQYVPFPAGSYELRVKRDMTGNLPIFAGIALSSLGGNYLVQAENFDSEIVLPFTLTTDEEVQVRVGSSAAVGSQVAFTDIYVGAPGHYIDGSTRPDDAGGIIQPEDFRWRWVGAPHASESVMEIETVAGITSQNSIAGLSSRDGKPAIRHISTGGGSAYLFSPIPTSVRPLSTVMATIHLEAPQINIVSSNARKIGTETPQTVSAQAPNVPGSHPLRRFSGALTSVFQTRLIAGTTWGSPDVWWSDYALIAGEYYGDYFDGDTKWVMIDGVWMHTRWLPDGTSVATMPDDAVAMTVERSTDGGTTWKMVTESLAAGEHQLVDAEALSSGVTLYRVTSFAATGAATVREYPVPADSMKVWLGAGQGFGDTAGLPYDPTLGLAPERERGMWRLAGNTRVAWAGEQAGRTVAAGGRLFEGSEESASYEDLSRIFLNPEPLHLYRSPNGDHVYGVLSSPDLQRAPGVGVWSYGFQIEEADRE